MACRGAEADRRGTEALEEELTRIECYQGTFYCSSPTLHSSQGSG